MNLLVAATHLEALSRPNHSVLVPQGWMSMGWEKPASFYRQKHVGDHGPFFLGSFDTVEVGAAYEELDSEDLLAEMNLWFRLVKVGGVVSIKALDAMGLFASVAEGTTSLQTAGEFLLQSNSNRLSSYETVRKDIEAAGGQVISFSRCLTPQYFIMEATRT